MSPSNSSTEKGRLSLKRKPSRTWILQAACGLLVALATVSSGSTPAAAVRKHQRLRVKNDFKTPEEVVQYYCARDASGFIWSGLLDSERKAFTLWRDVPQQDSFFIAKKYDVLPARSSAKDKASVEVRYELTGIGDAFGTRMPAPEKELRVIFDLKKVNGSWKIVSPDASRISPVVLESKFPSAAAQANNAVQ